MSSSAKIARRQAPASARQFTPLGALFLALLLLLMGGAAAAERSPAAGKARQPLPDFDRVRQTVHAHFPAAKKEPWAIISRSQLQPIFEDLARVGWRVADEKEILEAVLADDSLLVKNLRTAKGRKLAEQISRYPDGYDRLERLGRLPRGPIFISDLVRGPDGYKLIEYMTETTWGQNMGAMVSQAPRGHDFNKATGHLYTVDDLLKRLEQSLRSAKQAAPKTPLAK